MENFLINRQLPLAFSVFSEDLLGATNNPPITPNNVISESGDFIISETGDFLITEI